MYNYKDRVKIRLGEGNTTLFALTYRQSTLHKCKQTPAQGVSSTNISLFAYLCHTLDRTCALAPPVQHVNTEDMQNKKYTICALIPTKSPTQMQLNIHPGATSARIATLHHSHSPTVHVAAPVPLHRKNPKPEHLVDQFLQQVETLSGINWIST
jgi:hypothetical protein